MAGKFQLSKFLDLDIDDPFFEPLISDYPEDENNIGFVKWFDKKSREGATALVFNDESGMGAFICLKDENEPLVLQHDVIPAVPRKKISTLRLAERYRGQRLGEGAIGLALWNWQKSNQQEIYLTVFEKQDVLIDLIEKFGFKMMGYNENGECVYLKSRKNLDYSDPYKSFPFINPDFETAGYLIVNDIYHDTLFPYSELKNTIQEQVALSVANGISKIYIGSPYNRPHFQIGEPLLVYRRYTNGPGQKTYKSCLTSYCVVTDVIIAKEYNRSLITIEDLLRRISNKSVYDENEIKIKYENEKNLVIIEMLYYGFFGEGHNINHAWLSSNGYFASGVYPTENRASPEQFKALLMEGDVDVSNVIID